MTALLGRDKPICTMCGTEYPGPPKECPICEDPRQFVGWNGQEWTTLSAMAGKYENMFEQDEEGVFSIRSEPKFAIGQRAQVIQTPNGNVLWECVSLLDEATAERVEALGGLAAIAISHPHYYATMVEWSRAFGDVPIYLHEDCRKWVMYPAVNIQFWGGETKKLVGGLTLIRTPGHFKGFQVLHSSGHGKGEHGEGRGALFAGDQPRICMDRQWVSFMYSYPNFIPLPADAVREIARRLSEYRYDRIYGAVEGWIVPSGAEEVMKKSAERYVKAIEADEHNSTGQIVAKS
jgi:glyoxylase-like metal-dependent hydrolase (beta-lactamase superfamily II)